MFSKSNLPKGCWRFESRFEDYLGGAADSEFDQHLTQCEACRTALRELQLAGDLLRGSWEPVSEPSPAFLANVMAQIGQEKARLESRVSFWAPLEFLASRLSFTAAMVLLVLSAYLVDLAPRRTAPAPTMRTELSASDFPQPPGEPMSNEEVLESLAERNNGR